MIRIPQKKVAVVPIFDSKETKGGIIKASTFNYKRDKVIFEIYDYRSNKKLDEAEDKERVAFLINKYWKAGYRSATYRQVKIKEEDQPLDAGERCDQGIVKYRGRNVREVDIGDYVFFSGYTGSLVYIEGEGRLIIMPEEFIICTFNLDEEKMKIPGLFFRDKKGEYFPATYEDAMNIIAESFTLLNMTVDVKPEGLKHEEYNRV